jgi:hypothetical protein
MLTAQILVAMSATVVGIQPSSDVAFEHVELVEVNHLYDERGQHLLDQLIFYDWSVQLSRFDVRAWRKVKSSAQLPVRSWQDGDYHVTWYDRGILRHVRAAAFRETWTQYDPEVLARKQLPVEQRRELRSPRSTTFGVELERGVEASSDSP